jgi:23S rRNA (pseudouridine1915-N3)-methyltransferase
MNVTLLMIGQTGEQYLQAGIVEYEERIRRYVPFVSEVIPGLRNTKNMSPAQLKIMESEMIMKKLNPDDHVILLDEGGTQYSSTKFAATFQKKMNASIRHLVFVIGGSYGFDTSLYERADEKLSLSAMTFSHQMVRLIFLEQLYRALTIMRNEPYHHG